MAGGRLAEEGAGDLVVVSVSSCGLRPSELTPWSS